MSFFSRLSDIISCRIEDLIAEQAEPGTAISRIISEIEEGLAGAKRSVTAAGKSEERLKAELDERRQQAESWSSVARQELAAGRDDAARQALLRKREIEDLQAGIEQQLAAATSTREHLSTTMRAIEARLAEARRRQVEMQSPEFAAPAAAKAKVTTPLAATASPTVDRTRAAQIEAELEALRKELKRG